MATESPELAGCREECVELLKTMDREDVLEVLLSCDGFCEHCLDLLHSRIQDIVNKKGRKMSLSNDGAGVAEEFQPAEETDVPKLKNYKDSLSPGKESPLSSSYQKPAYVSSARQNGEITNAPPASINSHQEGSEILPNDGLLNVSAMVANDLSEEQKEQIRFSKIGRKKDFVCIEKINGRSTNILEGLQLHTKVFNSEEQKKIIECVYNLQRMGQKGQLRERTYSEPTKWMRGKGRITMQFGCCYNYAVDKNGNPPGIIRDEEVDPLPPVFRQMIKRMVRWHVLPPTCIPNSCIVNIYEEGDCIPPHIDHYDFLRPFCTVSFLTECNILFGSNLKIVSPGEFSGPVSIPLPVGSVLVLNGNGADVAKHCVPGVPAKRISITFRKMSDSKLPHSFSPEPELLGIKPLLYSPSAKTPYQQTHHQKPLSYHSAAKSFMQQDNYQSSKPAAKESKGDDTSNISFSIGNEDFPPLGSTNSSSRRRANRG